jgi:hypothetical protein
MECLFVLAQVDNLLDATYGTGGDGDFEAHTLSIEVKDTPGVLNSVRVRRIAPFVCISRLDVTG